MQTLSADDLIRALRASGLHDETTFAAIARELAALGPNPDLLATHLVRREYVTAYQLGKVVAGRSADLFLGSYRIFDKLGEGGMGKVYKARCWRHERDVALKVVRPNLLKNPVIRGRYEREVRAATAIDHPNVVALYEAGEAGGKHYLAMEFVNGVDLARVVREHGKLLVPEACEYVRQAAFGLHHLHRKGYVHRDVKPSNVLVSGERHVPEATEAAFVKLTDLGLIRDADLPNGERPAKLTRDGTVVGTPDYMAPEQARDSSNVDARADVYSLGCTLFFLLTGKPPFPDGTPIEKLFKHQLDPPPAVRVHRPDVPEGLSTLILQLMAKKPDRRPADALAVATALEPFTRYALGKVLGGYPLLLPGAPSAGGSSGSMNLTNEAAPPSGSGSGEPPAGGSSVVGMPSVRGWDPVGPGAALPAVTTVNRHGKPVNRRRGRRPGGRAAARRRKRKSNGGVGWVLALWALGLLAAVAGLVWVVRHKWGG